MSDARGLRDLSRIKEDWDDLASMDAAWFAKPSAHLADRKWHLEDFFENGRVNLRDDLALLKNAHITVIDGAALDFGCGLGRVTQAMAVRFNPCVGVDLSATMVELAERHNVHRGRCRYVANVRDDLQIFDSDSFVFVYSNNVLQHVPPALIERYLAELIRVLTPGGVLLLQLPVASMWVDTRTPRLRKLPRYHPHRVWNKIRSSILADRTTWYYRLKRLGLATNSLYALGLRPRIEMFCFEEARLVALSAAAGCSVTKLTSYLYDNIVHAKFGIVKGRGDSSGASDAAAAIATRGGLQ